MSAIDRERHENHPANYNQPLGFCCRHVQNGDAFIFFFLPFPTCMSPIGNILLIPDEGQRFKWDNELVGNLFATINEIIIQFRGKRNGPLPSDKDCANYS